MAITLRLDKGSPLTHQELDDNFTYLTGSISAIEAVTGSYVYSGSFDGSSTLTLYSGDTNYSIDLSGLTEDAELVPLNDFTGSIQIEVNNLTAATSSYLIDIDTGSLYYSSSVNLNTITFHQGDGTTESVTVDTGSSVDISALNNFTGSANLRLDSLEAATGSYLTGTDTGSFYVASSATNDTITLTKANGDSDDVRVNHIVSASYAATSSYANETEVTYATDSTSQTTTRVVHVTGTANAVNGATTTTSPVMPIFSGKTLGQDAFFTATWINNSEAGQQARPIAIESISGSNQLVFRVGSMNADIADAIMFQGVVFV